VNFLVLNVRGTPTNTFSDLWKSLAVVSVTPCTIVSQTLIAGMTHSLRRIAAL
jgi:hypothetical protein